MIKRALRATLPQLSLDEAVNGRKAQLMMSKIPFDLILCDWEMPEMSGLELLHWARQHEHYAKVPFIMITSRGDKGHVIEAVKEGVSDYLTKPFSGEQLVQKVLKQVGRKLRNATPPNARPNPFHSSANLLAGNNNIAATGGQPGATAENPAADPGAAMPPAAPQVKGLFKDSANLLTGNARPAVSSKAKASSKAGLAQVRFADTSLNAVIKSITLTEVRLVARADSRFPGILDQAVVDISIDGGDVAARLNGYVHMLQAMDNRADADFVSVVIRFVDEDPAKLEHLSKFIARL